MVIFDQIINSSNVYLFELTLDGHLSHHLLPAPFRLKIENTTLKCLIDSFYGNSLFISTIHNVLKKQTLQDKL